MSETTGQNKEDLSSMMANDSTEVFFRAPTDGELSYLSQLANQQIDLEAEILEKEEALALRKKQLSDLSELTIPAALERVGVAEIKLTDGSSIKVKEDVHASIKEENREPAFKWLEDTGNDGIIKNEVKLPFGKGQDNEAKVLLDILSSRGYSYTNSRSVHAQTLKAFVRKQLEAGKAVPTDIFSIHIKKIATITVPKKR